MMIRLCCNCLVQDAKACPIGPDKGNQFDSYRETVDLCEACTEALLSGNFTILAERHQHERTIKV